MESKTWDSFAPFYNLFMKKDSKGYKEMYDSIRKVITGKNVLELATGTGLIAKNVASSANHIDATDYSEKMIEQAKKGKNPKNITFEVQDATNLKYNDKTYDVIIISNALHLLPNPDKAIHEIKRVLKNDGILICPTFLKTDINKLPLFKKIGMKSIYRLGFQTCNQWTEAEFLSYLENNNFSIIKHKVIDCTLPLCYVECQEIKN
ncbi:S-adenosyl-L-methionine-dependent methyltransferase [Anaeromyces robustus]|uniref:S-adenosyl-L-methionine-dependent methyltransferase n=1 Tax=Anaeromyces robustus TaxID=1754192 RepID=A0A1Y1XLQ6_9FUNG|nr:S-adenosyl-L-methionine-dependent methyltransferase [Anaeromyces robustus]|eukprot:ORX86436.1 S-adenosyl-L-methionine-dependent methyltransferase [Anaeromyces robustus]